MGGDGVHPVGRRTYENLVFARNAKAAEETVYGFIRADAYEQIRRRQILFGVGVCIAKGAEKLLEVVLMRIRVAVEAEEINCGFDMIF